MPPPALLGRSSTVQTLGVFGVGLIAGASVLLLFRQLFQPPEQHKLEHKSAFVLSVRLKLQPGKASAFLELWRPLAEHCKAYEPGTLSYECCLSDKENDVVVIYERYTNKAYLTDVHQKSLPFVTFKQALADSDLVVSKSGESFIESDVGYMQR
jgi:quinol monooxygenase YgiN